MKLALSWVNAEGAKAATLCPVPIFSCTAVGPATTSSSEALADFCQLVHDDRFRLAPAPVDFCCIAPGCGALRVKKGDAMGAVHVTDAEDPDDVGFVWHTASLLTNEVHTSTLFLMAAVCPGKSCWMRAYDRLSTYMAYSLNATMIKIDTCCAHCLQPIDPARRVPCHDKCGDEWYCSQAHADAGRIAHDYTHRVHQQVEAKRRTCGACGTQTIALRSCGRCRKVYYCNRECQGGHWAHHKTVCIPKE